VGEGNNEARARVRQKKEGGEKLTAWGWAAAFKGGWHGGGGGGRKEGGMWHRRDAWRRGVGRAAGRGTVLAGAVGGRSVTREAGEPLREADRWAGCGVGPVWQQGKEGGSEWQVGPSGSLMNSKQSKSIFKCVPT
jgi:hypothetical protein